MKYLLIILTSFFYFTVPALANETLDLNQNRIENFDIDAETQKYIDTLTGEQKEQSDAYFEGGYWLLLWGLIVELFVAWLLLAKGLSKKIKSIAEKISTKVNLTNFLYLCIYSVVTYLIVLPWTIYADYFREKKYNLLNQSFGEWFGEEIISLTLVTVFLGLLLTLLYVAIRKVRNTWWIWASGITMIFLVLILFISPVFISPLFNEYTPLPEGEVKESILSMAKANGVPVENVYMFDASKQSDRISANVSGIGSTIRISMNDNLMNTCTEEEIKAVMGHELGHYVLNHGYESLLMFGLVFLFGFAFINWGFERALKKWGQNWGIDGLSDIAGLPLFMVLFSIYFFFATPITNTIIRVNETEADIYGLNAANEPEGFASVSMKLSTYRKISPGSVERFLFFDHPSGYDRVRMSMEWKAENLEE
ncbi:MAG: M48 family metallopeptidase [Cyclobacteriaceae bacterium]